MSTNELKFDPSTDRDELAITIKEIINNTEVGKNFAHNYFDPAQEQEQTEMLIKAARQLSGGNLVTMSQLIRALELLILSGDLMRVEPEENAELAEPEEDTHPRDKNGKLLSQSQLDWSEMTKFVETHSVAECRNRARSDKQFAHFLETNLRREMGGISDSTGVAPLPPDAQLVAFARKYQVEAVQNLKPRNGVVILAGEMVPYKTFLDMVDRATAARLL